MPCSSETRLVAHLSRPAAVLDVVVLRVGVQQPVGRRLDAVPTTAAEFLYHLAVLSVVMRSQSLLDIAHIRDNTALPGLIAARLPPHSAAQSIPCDEVGLPQRHV